MGEIYQKSPLMKILILSWRGPGHPHEGGAEKVTHIYAKSWASLGHEVTLFTSAFTGSKNLEYVDGVKVIRRGSQAFGVKIAAFLWYLFENLDKFDLVFDHFHGIPFFTPIYVRSRKIAFIHEVATQVWSLNTWPKPLNLMPAIIGRYGEPFVFKIYAGCEFLTVSNSTKSDLVNFGVDEKLITVINNGVEVDSTNSKSRMVKNKLFTVTYLGAIAKDKGIEDALKAFSISYKQDGDMQMWIVGKGHGDYVEELVRECKKIGIDKAVKFWGFVSDRKKCELLSKSSLLLNLSIHEGWGLVNIEANSFAVPVIGYKVSGTVDSVVDGETGVLCDKGNVESVSNAILELKNDVKKYTLLSKGAKRWSEKFSWKNSVSKSIELINKYE